MISASQRLTALLARVLRSEAASGRLNQLAWAVLRVVAGAVLIQHGLEKLDDIQGFADAYVVVLGLPFPIFFSYCAAFAELIGAPLLILGLFTRPAAAALVGTMTVAIIHHLKVAGLNLAYLELSLLYAACFGFFLVNGGGRFSLDALLSGWLGTARAHQVQSLEASLTAREEPALNAEEASAQP